MVFTQQASGRDRLGSDGSSVGDGEVATRLGAAQPVTAVDYAVPQLGRHGPGELIDGPRGQPQIDRATFLVAMPARLGFLATLALQVVEGPLHDCSKLIHVSRLERGK